jgi:hypothetical protein
MQPIPIIYDPIYDDPAVMDFQKWWFTKLRIEMFRNQDKPGYLHNDAELLRGLVGCTSRNFWTQKSSVVMDRFNRTSDGQWIFDESVLCLVGNKQTGKSGAKPSTYIEKDLFLELVPLKEITPLEIYQNYPRKVAKDKALTAIEKAIGKFARELKISPAESAHRILEATAEFSKSPAGNRGNYTPHPTTWFNQGRFKDERSEWYRTESNGTAARNASEVAGTDEF